MEEGSSQTGRAWDKEGRKHQVVLVRRAQGMESPCHQGLKKGREEREKQNAQPAVEKEAGTASQTHANSNYAAVLATLAQMAMQEEWWFSSAWAFLMLMAEAPNITALIATLYLQTICFSFVQLYLFKQHLTFRVIRHSSKCTNNRCNKFDVKFVYNNFKHHHKIDKKPDKAQTILAAKLCRLTALSCKVDCCVRSHLQQLFVLPTKFFKSLRFMPPIFHTHRAGISHVLFTSTAFTGLLLHSRTISHFITFAQTLQAKHSRRQFTSNREMIIPHYHCDCRFLADDAFQQHAQRKHLTFFSVNAYFLNGIAKRVIKDLMASVREQMRKLLLRAKPKFFDTVFLTRSDTNMSSIWQVWQVLCWIEKSDHIPSANPW